MIYVLISVTTSIQVCLLIQYHTQIILHTNSVTTPDVVVMHIVILLSRQLRYCLEQWRTEGWFDLFKTSPPQNSEILIKLNRNSLKVPKIKKLLLYEIKFLVPKTAASRTHD
jgi:hypothetical protein